MIPRMSADDIALLSSLLRCTDCYVEFGCGGSTLLASGLVRKSIITIDSSAEWLGKVRRACADKPMQPTLLHVDIGPTREWGFPTDLASRDRWTRYHSHPWTETSASTADLYLIDGRFRVACSMQVLLRCHPDARLTIHDYRSRPEYHVVERFARPIAETAELTVFERRAGFSHADAAALLFKHAFDPA